MRGMSLIVQVIAGLMAGMLLLYGGYIIVHGHLTPGGGFAGGVLVVAALILVSLAFGSVEQIERRRYIMSSVFEGFGGLLFLGLAFAGYFFADAFFRNNGVFFLGKPLELISGGLIPLSNIAIGIKVGAGLFAIFLALGASRFVMKE